MKAIPDLITQTVSANLDSATSGRWGITADKLASILVNGVLSNQSVAQISQKALQLLPVDQRTSRIATDLENFIISNLQQIMPRMEEEYRPINAKSGGVVNTSMDRPLGVCIMTYGQFKKIFPNLPKEKAEKYFPVIVQGMLDGGITTPLRQAAFLAQVNHETAGLNKLAEDISQNQATKQYEGKKILGNNQPGDGHKFIGQGLIHITGRYNYTTCGKALGLDLANHPELLSTDISVAVKSAIWFWNERGCNKAADTEIADNVSRKINPNEIKINPADITKGQLLRREYFNQAKNVLGIK